MKLWRFRKLTGSIYLPILIAILYCLPYSGCSSDSSPSPNSTVSSSPNHSLNANWRLLDSPSPTAAGDQSGVSFGVFNSKLYGIWHQQNTGGGPYGGAGPFHVTVAVHSSSGWSVVSGSNGLNQNPSVNGVFGKLAVSNSKLYAIWYEADSTEQIRAAVYNGNDSAPSWSSIDGGGASGMNFNASKHAFSPVLITFNSKLYATWNEANSEDSGAGEALRVAVYNGNDSAPSWTFVDGNVFTGLNYDSTQPAWNAQFAVFNSKLYLTWTEGMCFLGGTACQIRMKVYGGNDASPSWSSADGGSGLNVNSSDTTNAPWPVVFNSKLYVGWTEEASGGGASEVHMKVYGGDDSSPSWALIDGIGSGLNLVSSATANGPTFAVYNSQLYGFWEEVPSLGTTYNYYVRVYNGNDSSPAWSNLGNSSAPLNCSGGLEGSAGQMVVFDDSLYAGWTEQCPPTDTERLMTFAEYFP